jgi:hypothetical protein
MKTNNLIGKIATGIALVGALAFGACAGNPVVERGFYRPNAVKFLESSSDNVLGDESRCTLAYSNGQNMYRGKNERSITNALKGDSFRFKNEEIQTCYINRTSEGRQDSFTLFSVQKPNGTRVVYEFNSNTGNVEKVSVERNNLVNFYFPNDKKVMALAKEKIDAYNKGIEQQKIKARESREQEALKLIR